MQSKSCQGWIFRVSFIYLSLTTLAFSEIIRILATNLMDITGGTQGIKNIPRFCVLFWNLDTNVKYFYFVWTVAVLLCLLSMRIAHRSAHLPWPRYMGPWAGRCTPILTSL